ncbi:MAG TPA: phenylalanine--tRNA ligase subunit beta [Patescibacteria group bacterium]|nr:phenylalanine--tRNA ligase subunit beta [Patescibacteria group bacterium]
MNILVPDNWLRSFVKTKATARKIKEYLSLCGPSVERINGTGKDIVYDIEITTNRPDAMSVVGVAREAAAILPRFGIGATLINDPYKLDVKKFVETHKREGAKRLEITTNADLNPRWTSIVLTGVKIGPSPDWLKENLEASGIRSLNSVVDITNYLMRAYGQPAHAFDFDRIRIDDITAVMKLRASRKGETLTTLDGKKHTLPGGDIVIEDGKGRLIDLAGIMGGQNSSITDKTTTVILFMQTYNPVTIRRTSMALAHRTEASSLFEKGHDSELVLPAITRGVELLKELTGAQTGSKLYDIYPSPYKPYPVTVSKAKTFAYIGNVLTDGDIEHMLKPLGFTTKLNKTEITALVPSWRSDIQIDVDVIEEVARMFGYHNITPRLPETEPPIVIPDSTLFWEQEIKIRLRDWGFTELYTYSMISENQMDIFGLDTSKAYKIANPLSQEWVYMRPSLWPSVLASVRENLHVTQSLKLFELSQTYHYREYELPAEAPTLLVAFTGHKFLEAKGVAQALFTMFGIPFPATPSIHDEYPKDWTDEKQFSLDKYGIICEVRKQLLGMVSITLPVTILELHIDELVKHAHPIPTYLPIPKFPPAVEDLAFIVPSGFAVGPLTETLKKVSKLIYRVTLLDAHNDTRTFHIEYLDRDKNLTSEDIRPVREKLIAAARSAYGVELKTA